MSWLKKSTTTVATKKAEEAPASPTAEPPAGETPPALPPMTSAPNVNRLSMSMRLPPITGPPQLKKTSGPGSGIGGSVPVPGGGVPPPANGGVPPAAASTNGGPAQSPTSPPATRSPFFARAAAASSNGSNGSTSPKHPAFAKAAPPPPAELDESSAGPTSPTSTRSAEPEAEGSPSLGSSLSGTLSGSAKSVPSHRDRKSFHPAFAAVPPPKPGGFNKPVPPVFFTAGACAPGEPIHELLPEYEANQRARIRLRV